MKPASSRIESHCDRYPNDCYKTILDTIEVAPSRRKWVKKKKINCNFRIANNCEAWRFSKVPAEYEVVTKKINTIKDTNFILK